MTKKKIDLVQIIRDNPGCVAIVDNDFWILHREHPSKNPNEDDDDGSVTKWDEDNVLATSDDDLKRLGDGGYGGDILQALAVIVGITVESV